MGGMRKKFSRLFSFLQPSSSQPPPDTTPRRYSHLSEQNAGGPRPTRQLSLPFSGEPDRKKNPLQNKGLSTDSSIDLVSNNSRIQESEDERGASPVQSSKAADSFEASSRSSLPPSLLDSVKGLSRLSDPERMIIDQSPSEDSQTCAPPASTLPMMPSLLSTTELHSHSHPTIAVSSPTGTSSAGAAISPTPTTLISSTTTTPINAHSVSTSPHPSPTADTTMSNHTTTVSPSHTHTLAPAPHIAITSSIPTSPILAPHMTAADSSQAHSGPVMFPASRASPSPTPSVSSESSALSLTLDTPASATASQLELVHNHWERLPSVSSSYRERDYSVDSRMEVESPVPMPGGREAVAIPEDAIPLLGATSPTSAFTSTSTSTSTAMDSAFLASLHPATTMSNLSSISPLIAPAPCTLR
eukprot:TRINITY_DN19866_c0_g1::TRINITY_DN19866_c0_g1_i1::g.28958::m.28958 TRINITY_DN19866_c0_g1::TRINITY_DN19866_c0_g1_i1::g.28958  ORF type:complete len:415 (+),score=37.21 TRINITY_DN19866_c0_g1_i1:154-1398(+)